MEKETEKLSYEPPVLEVVEIKAEAGFATSGGNSQYESGGTLDW